MTDKVQKIREEVERIINRRLNLINGYYFDLNEETNGLTNEIIDTIELLQEEPVPQFKVGDTIRSKVWESAVHKITSMDDKSYRLDNGGKIDISSQQLWELVEEYVSGELEKAAGNYAFTMSGEDEVSKYYAFLAGAKWQKENLWKPADGDDLPEYEREVVVFTQNFPDDAGMMRVAIGHRPTPEGYDGRSLTTGEVKHYTPKTYDKGGWNIPDIVYWLDVELPKEIEL